MASVNDHSDNERGNPLPISSKVFLYASSYHIPHNTYHDLCYTSRGTLAGMRNSSMGPPWNIDSTTHHTMSERSYHGSTSRSQEREREREEREREERGERERERGLTTTNNKKKTRTRRTRQREREREREGGGGWGGGEIEIKISTI